MAEKKGNTKQGFFKKMFYEKGQEEKEIAESKPRKPTKKNFAGQSPHLKEVLENLERDGVADSKGEFSLDREKARQKMRQFQLADPYRYVLELVQAAVLKGASRIRFDIDADDMRMKFDGEPFTKKDFDQIYASLFVKLDRKPTRARKQLALGLNAAMALNPRYIRVQSGDGKTGAELELRPKKPDVYAEAEKPVTGTQIHIKSRFRPGLFVSFFKNLSGTLPEENNLRVYCRMADVEIDLENTIISKGMELPGR